MLEPFVTLDRITDGANGDGWDFSTEQISCYNYVSVVGGGHIVSLVIAFMQIALPLMLVHSEWHDITTNVGEALFVKSNP